MSDPAPSEPKTAPGGPPPFWGPLRLPAFRRLWIANVVSNVGGWMQTAGAGWIMTELAPADDKALFVAALAAATTVPVFFFGFPAGVLADRFDRRVYILCCQGWMMAAAATLAALAWTGHLNHWNLLALIFCVGIGNAVNAPAWHAVVPEIVGSRHLPQAIALNSAGFNLARTVGPVIGQLLHGLFGAVALFAVNTCTFSSVIYAIARWRRPPEARAAQRRESFVEGFLSGIAFVRGAPALHAVWARGACFFMPAIAFSTMLPLLGRDYLHLDATAYGVLFSSFGVGAVLGTMTLPRVNALFGADRANIGAMLLSAAAMVAAAQTLQPVVVGVALAVAGGCWMVVIANNNVAVQSLLPSWVRARAMAVHQLVFFGSMTVGQVAWGVVADRVGVPWAITAGAALLVATTILAAAIRLPAPGATAGRG